MLLKSKQLCVIKLTQIPFGTGLLKAACRQTPSPKAALQRHPGRTKPPPALSCLAAPLPALLCFLSMMCCSPGTVSVLGPTATSLPRAWFFCRRGSPCLSLPSRGQLCISLLPCLVREAPVYLSSRNGEVRCLLAVCLGKRSRAGVLGALQPKQREGGDNCLCGSPYVRILSFPSSSPASGLAYSESGRSKEGN